jgi:hypothetical protein
MMVLEDAGFGEHGQAPDDLGQIDVTAQIVPSRAARTMQAVSAAEVAGC